MNEILARMNADRALARRQAVEKLINGPVVRRCYGCGGVLTDDEPRITIYINRKVGGKTFHQSCTEKETSQCNTETDQNRQ